MKEREVDVTEGKPRRKVDEKGDGLYKSGVRQSKRESQEGL